MAWSEDLQPCCLGRFARRRALPQRQRRPTTGPHGERDQETNAQVVALGPVDPAF